MPVQSGDAPSNGELELLAALPIPSRDVRTRTFDLGNAPEDGTHELSRLLCHVEDHHKRLGAMEAKLESTPFRAAPAYARSPYQRPGVSLGSYHTPPSAWRGFSSHVPPSPGTAHTPKQPTDSGDVRSFAATKQGKQSIDRDLFSTIYDKTYRKSRQSGMMAGGSLLGLLSMPFGPIGMAAGGMLGALIGAVIGLAIDLRAAKRRLRDQELTSRRLKSLIRWARERFHDDEEIIQLIEKVTLEFTPHARIADGSESARKLLKLLERWISQKTVTRCLWIYMDRLLENWSELNIGAFLRAMRVFDTLRIMYYYSGRGLSDQELQFRKKMEALLSHESVQILLRHQGMYPTPSETRVMECMVYADRWKGGRRRGAGVGHLLDTHIVIGSSPNQMSQASPKAGSEPGEPTKSADSDSSSGDVEGYRSRSTPEGGLERTGSGHQMGTSASSSQPCPLEATRMVLKKPFFRNWDDFINFDLSLKHKMAITLSEFDLLMQKRDDPVTGWDLCVNKKDMKVAKQQQGDLGVITVRAWATIRGVDARAAFCLFYDMGKRLTWDKVFNEMKLLESTKEGSDIVYTLLKMPSIAGGIAARDFLQFRRVRVQEDGTILIVLRSAEHPDLPERKPYIRVESYMSGYILGQSWDDNVPILDLFLMSCTDIKGLIPKWLVNMQAPRSCNEWVNGLRTAAVDYQKSNLSYATECQKIVEEVNVDNPWDFEVMKNVSQAGPDDIFEARVCFLCSLELFPVRDPREAA